MHLAAQSLRSRPTAYVGAFVALVLAAALVTSSGVLLETALRSRERLLLAMTTSFGGFAVLIAVVVVWGTLSVTVAARRPELATLRALGARPRQVLGAVAGEAALLAGLAVVVGTAPGIAVARTLLGRLSRLEVVPVTVTLSAGLPSLAAAAAVTAAAAGLAGAAAAAGPAWGSPVAEMAEWVGTSGDRGSAGGSWRGRVGLVLLVLGGCTSLTPLVLRNEVGAAGTGSAGLLLVLGIVVLGPAVTRPLLAQLTRPLTLLRASGFLAREAAAGDLRRVGAVATPMVLAVGLTLTMVHTQTVLAEAATRQVEAGVVADAVVALPRGEPGGSADLRELASLPGVAVAVPTATLALVVPHRLFGDDEPVHLAARAVAGSPGDVARVLDPGIVTGRIADLSGGTIALDVATARMLRVRLGDRVPVVPDPDGASGPQAPPRQLRLVATYDRGLGLGPALVPVTDLSAGVDVSVLVAAGAGESVAALERALASFASGHPGARVQDRSALLRATRVEALQAAWVNLLGLAVVLLYLAIAVVNTLVISTAGRRHEVLLLRLVGATPHQVLAASAVEALVVVALAVLLGVAAAAPPLAALSQALLGSPVPTGPSWVLTGLVLGAVVLALAATTLPTWRSLSVEQRWGRLHP